MSDQIKRYKHLKSGFIIEAAQLDENNASEIANWCQGQLVEEIPPDGGEPWDAINVYVGNTREPKRLSRGRYLVFHDGVFYVIQPNVFEVQHELADAPPIYDPYPKDPFHDNPQTSDPFAGVPRVGDQS